MPDSASRTTQTLSLLSPIGGARSDVQVILEPLDAGTRVKRAAIALVVGSVTLVLLLPIPLVHFGGALVFILSLVYAARQIKPQTILRSVKGPCPVCGEEQDFFLGAGLSGVKWPVALSCASCKKSLRLDGPGE